MSGIKRKCSNCKMCNERDSYDDMVCCDHCDQWLHYHCGGVGSTIADLRYYCPECLEMLTATYQLAKAAEDSIVRNLERQKRTTMKRVENVNNAEVAVTIDSETEVLDEVISKKVEGALSGIIRSEESDFQKDLEKIISGVVDSTIAKHLEGLKKLKLNDSVGGACAALQYSESDEQLCTTFNLCEVDGDVNVECGEMSVVDTAEKDFEDGPVGIDVVVGDTCDASSTEDICAAAPMEKAVITLPIKEPFQTHLVNEAIPKNYDYFLQQAATGGGKKLANTMRIVSNSVIVDSVLKTYSFDGQRKKGPFNIYPNVIKLIVKCTTEAHNKANALRKDFVPVTEIEVESYFKTSFIRYAEQRDA